MAVTQVCDDVMFKIFMLWHVSKNFYHIISQHQLKFIKLACRGAEATEVEMMTKWHMEFGLPPRKLCCRYSALLTEPWRSTGSGPCLSHRASTLLSNLAFVSQSAICLTEGCLSKANKLYSMKFSPHRSTSSVLSPSISTPISFFYIYFLIFIH